MARDLMPERLPQLRVSRKMRKWVEQYAKAARVSEADVQREALARMMMRQQMSSACSCSPDDRNQHGCRCGAGVGR